ncbi:right-handed parallel beta-helix repeat-containing protein [Psychromonas sp. MME1]|uniref:right-handed parallel beta-helix repeat-containing protein n=1 Tax=Psychromonas sp. MME1 TaxID=3231032 RepID=UPI0034E1B4C9
MDKNRRVVTAGIALSLFFIAACVATDKIVYPEMVANSAAIPPIESAPVIEPRLDIDSFSFTRNIYIDRHLEDDCDNYNVALRACGSGSELAFHSIKRAQQSAAAGVLFLIRGGNYNEVLHVTTSGRADAYLGYSAYANEKVTLLDINSEDSGEEYGAIWLDQVSYVLINGIDVRGSIGFGRLLNAHYNIITNSEFNESTIWRNGRGKSKRGGLYVAFSHYNRIVNNRFYKGTDALALVHSNHNLVADNRMDLAGHDLWNIKCGSFNVIRNNLFSNKNQKLGSVFDCEKGSMSWHGNGEFAQQKERLNSTQYNMIDNNIFKDAQHYYSTSGGNGIQYAGQNGIIRRNVFYHVNAGIGMASYKSEATYNYGNRIYNNTFHDNWCAAIAIGTPINNMTDNEYRNNILWNNQGFAASHCKENNGVQILLRSNKSVGRFINNNIASSVDDDVLGIWGRSINHSLLSYYISIGLVEFIDTLEEDPLFVDQQENDYRLQASSPMIDSGAFLTTIISPTGSGNQLQLADVKYFYDGFSIPGEVGDSIQIQGQSETAIIVKIDYEKQAIILNKAMSWNQGDGIALQYNGSSPNLGAIQYKAH